MKRLQKKHELLKRMHRLEECDIEVVKQENEQAKQVLAKYEHLIDEVTKSISDIESLIRESFNGLVPLSLDELQSQRRYLEYKQIDLKQLLVTKSNAAAIVDNNTKKLQKQQKKLTKLQDLIEEISIQMSQLHEKRSFNDTDELWLQSQGYGRR